MWKKQLLILLEIVMVIIFILSARWLAHPLPLHQYGYDYGFYAHAVSHTPLDSPKYFIGLTNDYGNHLFVFLNWLRLPQITSLQFLFIFFQLTTGVFIYFYLKKYSSLSAVLGIILFALSISQTKLYTMFLWKAAYGQLLLVLLLWSIERKKFLLGLVPILLMAITHKTSAILAWLVSTPLYFSEYKKYKILSLLSVVVVTSSVLYWLSGHQNELLQAGHNVQIGVFLSLKEYLIFSWYLFPLTIIGLYYSFINRKEMAWGALFGTSLVFMVFQLYFYQRIILYLDLALIIFSAVGIYYLSLQKSIKYLFVILIVLIGCYGLFKNSESISPQISQEEILEIKNFSINHQGAFLLGLSSQDGPWLLANLLGNIRLAAPGLFEDNHNRAQWQYYWDNPTDQLFLNNYPSPLFLYQRSITVYDEGWFCIEKVSKNFFKYVCHNK